MAVACHNHCMQPPFRPVVCNRSTVTMTGVFMELDDARDRPADPAEQALQALVSELDRCVEELEQARLRAAKLLLARRSGRTWTDIVSGESRPLVVERISTVLAALATAGHTWRREQAAALQGEHVSINRIAAMFGVTRQRISALLKE
jgi:hypothetical protein